MAQRPSSGEAALDRAVQLAGRAPEHVLQVVCTSSYTPGFTGAWPASSSSGRARSSWSAHGLTGLERFVAGSTVETIVREAPCTVAVVCPTT